MGKRFVLYGFVGICAEIFWTGVGSFLQGDIRLTGFTYIWMFPIYGMTVFFEPLQHKIKNWPLVLRGGVYTVIIFFVEYNSGLLLRHILGVCPWNYTGLTTINGLIKLDFAPLWFCFGMLLEKVHNTLDEISVLLRA